MIHPLIIAIWVTDAVAVLLLFTAALRAEPVVRLWRPAAATRRQLSLERSLEAASLLGRAGAVVAVIGSVALLVAMTAVLPTVVPGAMCGTGVVEAADAVPALLLRGTTLILLQGWAVLDRLDRSAPRAPLARWTAAALLPIAPVAAWAAIQTALALARLDGQQAVDCCAAMYAEAARATAGPAASRPEKSLELVLFGLGGALLVVVGTALARTRILFRAAPVGALALVAAAWTPLAADVLVQRLAPYHYEVLAHPCPWCLFLPEHQGVGYLVFGALALTTLEAVAAAIALASRGPAAIRSAAEARARRAAGTIASATAVFILVAVAPALSWWWRFGMWL